MNTDLMFSSKTDMWETPQDFFDELNKEFHFNLDACATWENKKCDRFFGISKSVFTDGLVNDWYGRVWCNPPYGRIIGKWVQKAYESVYEYETAETVVMLLPARTDTKWFHDYIYGIAKIRFIKGRLKFGESKNSAPFPSMVVIFDEE